MKDKREYPVEEGKVKQSCGPCAFPQRPTNLYTVLKKIESLTILHNMELNFIFSI